MFENHKENVQLYKYLSQAKHGILYASQESEIGNKTRTEIRNWVDKKNQRSKNTALRREDQVYHNLDVLEMVDAKLEWLENYEAMKEQGLI